MKITLVLLAAAFTGAIANAAGEFAKGCEKASTEVLCVGQKDCAISQIMDGSKKGNDSEKGGYEECKEFAQFAKAQGNSLDSKRAITSAKAKLAEFNKEIKKDFPFITVTADWARLELEDVFSNARFMQHYGRDQRERSQIKGIGKEEQFQMKYLDGVKTALNNVGADKDGKDALKAKIKEIRFAFHTNGRTASKQDFKVVDKVLLVPGVYWFDQTAYASDIQKFIETKM